MATDFADHFSTQAAQYATYRPHYPAELFGYLASICAQTGVAYDCATGNGQAAVALADHFRHVLAGDPSDEQLSRAQAHPRVRYLLATGERLPLRTSSMDLVIIAQALHWLDRTRFFAEVRRVLKPRGWFAAWSYGIAHIDTAVDSVVQILYRDILEPYWPAERRFVESGYAEFDWPFPLLATPHFFMSAEWTRQQLSGYLSSWSAVQRYRQRHGEDPLRLIDKKLQHAWPDTGTRCVQWPLSIKLGAAN